MIRTLKFLFYKGEKGKFNLKAHISTKQLTFQHFGDPTQVLDLKTTSLDGRSLETNEVLIKWLAAPINPADINQIEGVYAIKPELPAVGGNEGCGIVEEVGSHVENFKHGDLVIADSALGTWCEYGIYDSSLLYAVDKGLSTMSASMLKVNPSTAYRLLKDFVHLNPGDTIVQNGANSTVGQYVIQICNILGFKSINVIRERPNIGDLKDKLYKLGATQVLSENEFTSTIRDLNARLALNCIGGRSSLHLSRALSRGGCMVTYGGMSKQPLQVTTSSLIFNDIILRGFWISEWYKRKENLHERQYMYEELTRWFKNGQLQQVDYEENNIENFKTAIQNSINSSKIKQVFVF